jgi:glutamine synthetase
MPMATGTSIPMCRARSALQAPAKNGRAEKAITGSAYNRARTLPRTLESALDRFSSCKPVRNLLGEEFFEIFYAVKDYELFNYQSVVSSWEREHLLLRV